MILTLQMEDSAQAYFNALRAAHFPAHANYLDAHITLFYKLPDEEEGILSALPGLAGRPPLLLDVTGVFSFGQGCAYSLHSEALSSFHAAMQQQWLPHLIKQDQQPLRPHITIQNKVTTFKASQTREKLMEDFSPFQVKTTGIYTWKYLHGPWKPLAFYPFVR
ncbi:2'-5' RNA ligase family protein [Chitinophaga sp. sic0106]|uniref:2'-5' RNA ligase family protein n=1 Tax=Chitinophaga sp. sic0106 TaxID=2854785 RepID=UPI001C4635D0|nr:2'-5' RNA ligase family protein [Chitinophaga sp. sic0106]MBV7529573.1 2'-5' RNA ligase family protein [Chitinophaga sp. sic0106]